MEMRQSERKGLLKRIGRKEACWSRVGFKERPFVSGTDTLIPTGEICIENVELPPVGISATRGMSLRVISSLEYFPSSLILSWNNLR